MENKITAQMLSEFKFFEGIPAEELETVAKGATLRTRPARSFVYCEGDPAEHIYLVTSGMVKLCTVSARGRELLRKIVGKGDVFGESALTVDGDRDEHAIAIRMPNTYITLKVADVRELVAKNPILMQRVIDHFGKRVRSVETKIEDYVLSDSRSRIIQLLIDLTSDRGEESDRGIVSHHYMTHQDMANITGASRQFATSLLNELRAKGLIDFDRVRLFTKNLEGLKLEKNK
jgi:CRP/FNR family transcriptional regulator, cyclic AMP receptor protein